VLITSEVLGIANVQRQEWLTGVSYFEALVLTKDRVIVVRNGEGGGVLMYGSSTTLGRGRARVQTKRLIGRSPEELLNASEDNYAIPVSEIERVELKKFWGGAFINIITREKKRRWGADGLAGQEKTRFSEYEEVFRPVFPDRLTVSTRFASVKLLAVASPVIVGACWLFWFLFSAPGGWVFAVAIMIIMLVAVAVSLLFQRHFNKQFREA
jgi:hypothetical protein